MLLKSRVQWIEKGDERGMAIVEMSLVAMAFFALVIGILDVGRAVYPA